MRDRRRKLDEPFNPFAANAKNVRAKKRNESLASQASETKDNSQSQSSKPDFDKSDFDKSSPASENWLGDLLARKKSEHSANVEQERLRKERERQRELREEQERQRLLQQKIDPYKARLMSDIMDEISKIDPINLTKRGKTNLNTNAFAKESDPSEFLVYVRNKGLMRSDNFFRMASGKEDFDTQENDHVLLFESNAPRSAKELCFQSGNGMFLTSEGAFGVQWVDFDDFSTSELEKLRSKSEIMDVDYFHDDDEIGHFVVARKDGFKVIHTLGSRSRNVLSSDGKRSSMTFFSPNGWHVAFAGGSPEISIYSVITHKKSHEIYTGYGLISARFSDHSEVLFATFSSGKMIVIEVETGAIIDEFDFDTDEYDRPEWAREGMNVYGTNLDIDEDGHFIQNNRTRCGRYILRETEVIDTVGTKSIDFRNWFSIVPVPLYAEQSYHSIRTEIFTATLEAVNKELIGHGFSIAASLNIDDAQNFEIQWKSGVI